MDRKEFTESLKVNTTRKQTLEYIKENKEELRLTDNGPDIDKIVQEMKNEGQLDLNLGPIFSEEDKAEMFENIGKEPGK